MDLWKDGWYFDTCEVETHLAFISPVGEPVHHMLLLASGCKTQRFAGHTLLVVDISVEHIGLAWATETDSANPLSKTVWLQASSWQPKSSSSLHPRVNESSDSMYTPQTAHPYSQVNMLQMSTTSAKTSYTEGRADTLWVWNSQS